jgi:hypothetical protein
MLQVNLIHEIDRLLQAGELSQREIAARLHVSRGTVGAIATGRRGLHGRQTVRKRPPRALIARRCPDCGYRVYAPCRICTTRQHKNRQLLIQRVQMETVADNSDRLTHSL